MCPPSGIEGVARDTSMSKRSEAMRMWLLGGFSVSVGSRTIEGRAWRLRKRAEPKLKEPGQVEWLKLLDSDNGNLRAAMTWFLDKGDIEAAVRMAWALWIFWLIHGHQGEGRRWIEEALSKGAQLTTHTRAMALGVQFSTYYGLGSPEQLEQIGEEAVALFR